MPLRDTYAGCPLCAGSTAPLGTADCTRHSLWHDALPKTLEWMRCSQCGHVHTRHYWNETGIAEIYRKAHADQLASAAELDAKRLAWSAVVERVVGLMGGYGKTLRSGKTPVWMDVGCGDGALTMTAADFGFSAIGLDARTDAVARIRQLGFQALQGDFMKARFDDPVDILSMMDVLEHFPYPRQALTKACEVLGTGGLIVISLPDISCSSWRIMDAAQANPYWPEIEHHHNFSRQRLFALLDECGFDVVDFAIPRRYKAQMEVYARKRLIARP